MRKNKKIGFLIVSVIIGFMLAVQLRLVKEPEVRDTRDTWELKVDLSNEQKLQVQLMKEITSLEQQLGRYESELQGSKEQALLHTLEALKEEAGLTEVTGQGILLTIVPLASGMIEREGVQQISPELLKRLINELNMFDAEQIAINDQRVINSTVVREINGITKVDGVSLNTFPIEIKVIAPDAEKIRDRLKVSQSMEEFFIEDLSLEISNTMPSITIPPYRNDIMVTYMHSVIQGKGEE